MQKEMLELEKLLEQEIKACSKLEQYVTEKKNYLIKGDIKGVMDVDVELDKYNTAVEQLEKKRHELYPKKQTLKEIIEEVKEPEKAEKLMEMRNTLSTKLNKVQKENTINGELLKHSLKIIENSISSIVTALVPENSAYNYKGAIKQEEPQQTISSVIHDV